MLPVNSQLQNIHSRNMLLLRTLIFVLPCVISVYGQGYPLFPWIWRAFPTCPNARCAPIPAEVPQYCIVEGGATFIGGILCKSCDFVIPGCFTPSEIRPCPHILCPALTNVSETCLKEGEIINYENTQCRDCDTIDPFCNDLTLDICPNHIIDCMGVPKGTPTKCINQQVITYNDKPCLTCPFLKTDVPECNTPDYRRCPGLSCVDTSGIPSECITEGEMTVLGSGRCQTCPTVNPSCPFMKIEICAIFDRNCIADPTGIPDECIDQSVILHNGKTCLTCPELKSDAKCSIAAPSAPVAMQELPQCPDNYCPPINGIPSNCISDPEIVNINGQSCKKCPVIDPFCPGLNLDICQNHILDCFGVPAGTSNRCKSQSVIGFMGRPCLTCPSLKTEVLGCVEETYNVCSGIQCPQIKGVPTMCLRPGPVTNLGGVQCRSCPQFMRVPGCLRFIESQQPPLGNTPNSGQLNALPECPDNFCPPLTGIPTTCITESEPGTANGQPCKKCPVIDPFCPGLNLNICQNHLVDCFGVPSTTPNRCKLQSVISFNNEACLTCPSLKANQPNCVEDSFSVCPSQQCPQVKGVPARCLQPGPVVNSITQCRRCPTVVRAPGCLEFSTIQEPVNPPQQRCPMLTCPPLPRVPTSCVRREIIVGRFGDECPGCTSIDPNCPEGNFNICENLRQTCRFSPPPGMPRSCIEQSVTSYMGRACLTCPDILPRCQRVN